MKEKSNSTEPLIKTFSGPVYLLNKVRREHSALVEALNEGNLEIAMDAVFNFSVSAYHIIDWVNKYRPDLKEKTSSLRRRPSMKLVRDICNASKHVELDENKDAYKKYPQSAASVEVSLTAKDCLPGLPVAGAWALKVVTVNDERKRFEDIAQSAITDVEQFFEENDISE
ncbi:hypothetical protein [Azotobacter beijerinckii]|uniref:hypothetical protein n=1 Tax=Azotobacter beijerinckii TaxID=170623 RepID=UPI002953822D|nr:hypothetical protein [Azotobacter beijerinckii]MDV7213566.1 hypothetical protein [Azotobacter beijerinckii]